MSWSTYEATKKIVNNIANNMSGISQIEQLKYCPNSQHKQNRFVWTLKTFSVHVDKTHFENII